MKGGLTTDSHAELLSSVLASSRGHVRSISFLLEYNSPLFDASHDRSALAVAIQGGFTEACEILLGAVDADPNYAGVKVPPSRARGSA